MIGGAGDRTILVAEDNYALRRTLVDALKGDGWTVLAAGRGDSALIVLGDHAGELHLLITGVLFADMSGADLAARVRSASPAARVLYLADHPEDLVQRHDVNRRTDSFLIKPVSMETLLHRVRDLLTRE
jgi:hypothetical protein